MNSPSPQPSPPEPDWFRVTLNSIGDAVIATDVNGHVTFMNSVAEALTGWNGAEALAKPLGTVFQIINEYTRKPAPDPVARVLREGVVVGLANHTALIAKDGRESPIEDSAAPINDPQGKMIGVVLVFHDVTERKKSEIALAESERRFRLMVDSVRDYAIFMLDTLGNVASWNRGAERLKGYRADEIIGSHFSRFNLPEDVQAGKPEREIKGAIQDGRFEDYGWRVRKDGTRFFANVVLTAVRDEAGKLIGFAKVTRDISERRAAEEQLRLSEERFRLLVESVKDYAIFRLDTEGRVISWNPGAQRINGYTADEIIGQSFAKFYPPEDVKSGKLEHELKVATETGRYEEEAIRIRKDGSPFWANVVISAVRDPAGKLLGFAKVTRDITERKNAEQKLRDAYAGLEMRVKERTAQLETANKLLAERTAQLETASRMKDEFLATLSHELRTPLMPMLGWAKMLASGQLDAKGTSKGIQVIEKNVRLQTRIIEDLLDISRIVSGKLKLDLKPTGLAAIIEAALEVVRGAAEVKGIELKFMMPSSVCPVLGDAARLQQVLWNLLTNAIKFTPNGGTVTVTLTRTEGFAVIAVQDTGEGISREFLPTLFERFSQADSSARRKHGGLGIGLSIVKHVVEMHGGKVAGESAGVGQGATFTVTLPLVKLAPNLESQYPLGDVPHLSGLKGTRVLVVDDEQDAREFLEAVLSGMGAQVSTAQSVPEAIAALDSFKPHVLISDIGMPEQDGYDLIRHIRAQGKNMPALALTAFARNEDRARAIAEGFQEHIAKPVEPQVLIQTVAKLASSAAN